MKGVQTTKRSPLINGGEKRSPLRISQNGLTRLQQMRNQCSVLTQDRNGDQPFIQKLFFL